MAINRTTQQTNSSTDSQGDPVTAYADDVDRGNIIAGPHVRNACRRHLEDIKHQAERGLRWDVETSNKVLRFFPAVLRLAGGQFDGKPFNLAPSQQFQIGSVFGWKRTETDGAEVRRFRRVYIETGKGSGKSPLAAGVGLYCLMFDGEGAAEVYAAGRSIDQSYVLFRDAVAMVDQSPRLKERITKSGGNPVWNLADLKTRSFFRPISREGAHSGPRPSVSLVDELHEHPNGTVIEMLERGFKFRRQPLLFMITNSGSDRNSVCWEEHQHAVRVAAGTREPDDDFTYVGEVVDDQTFSYVCALDKDDDPLTDPTCWQKANPLLGVTLKFDYLAGVVDQAKAIPGKLNGILRLHFCVWTDSETAWISRPTLESVLSDFDPEEHKGSEIYLGLDLSATKDLTCLAAVVRTGTKTVTRSDGATAKLPTFDAWVEGWTPEETLDERAKADHAPYRTWVDQGHLTTTEGKRVRYDHVAARIAEIDAEYDVKMLAFDRYAFSKFSDELDTFGLTIKQIEHPQGGKRRAKVPEETIEAAKQNDQEAPQGLWMPGSISELEGLILEGRIRLRSSPVLISALMGAATEEDPLGNKWFSKRKATMRIDAAVALAMCCGAATSNLVKDNTSVYESRGFLLFG